jgi:hypothetical protein
MLFSKLCDLAGYSSDFLMQQSPDTTTKRQMHTSEMQFFGST